MNPKIHDSIITDHGPGLLPAGVVAFANEARFNSAFHNEALTEYSVGGWDRDPLQELLEFFAPAVQVPERFNYKTGDSADYFLRVVGDQDIRAMGGRFGALDTARMTDVNEALDEKGLTILVDRREIDEDPMAREKATDRLRRILLRSELQRSIELLKAAATNTAKTWGSSADPDMDVFADLDTAENASGVRPNRVGYGSTARSKRITAVRAQETAGSWASAAWSDDELGAFLAVQALSFGDARVRGTSSLSNMLSDQVIMFLAESGLGKDDPSNIKRFTGRVGGAPVWTYEQELPHGWEITVAHKSKPKITSTLAIRKFTVS